MNAWLAYVGTPYYPPPQNLPSDGDVSPHPFESASGSVLFSLSEANQSTESSHKSFLTRITDHLSTSDCIQWTGKDSRPLPPEVEQLLKLRHFMKRHRFENFERALLRTPAPARQPSLLFNWLPTELIEVIFEHSIWSYLEDRKEEWDSDDFRDSLRGAFLTCSRIRSVLMSDRRLWPLIVAVISTRDLKTEHFTPLLETCAKLSCNTLDYIDMSAFGSDTTACWTTLNRWLLALVPSAKHIKILEAPMKFDPKRRCKCTACKSVEYLQGGSSSSPIDPRAICLLDLILSKASRLEKLSLRILEMPEAFSQHLRSSRPPRAAPRSVTFIIDVGTTPSESLLTFYSKLCRRSKKMTIVLGDHFGSSASVRNQDRQSLTNEILRSASSSLQRLTIRSRGLVDRLVFPACLPKLDYLRLSIGRKRPTIEIDSPSSICKLPSLRSVYLPASALQWMEATNITSALLCLDRLDRDLDIEQEAYRMFRTLSQWVHLAHLKLTVPFHAPPLATRTIELVVQRLMYNARAATPRGPKLDYLKSYDLEEYSMWSMRPSRPSTASNEQATNQIVNSSFLRTLRLAFGLDFDRE